MAQKWNPMGYSDAFVDRTCPACRADLGKWRPREKLFKSDGTEMSMDFLAKPASILKTSFGLYADKFSDKSTLVECPDCKHRWPLFKDGTVEDKGKISTSYSILELQRSEEILGVEARTVDNSRSRTAVKRAFNVSKEWLREISIEKQNSSSVHAGVEMGVDIAGVDLGSVNLGAKTAIMERYTSTEERRHIYSEEVSVEVPPLAKTRIEFTWKRLWQHGKVVQNLQNGTQVETPFRVVVGVTFDQAQVDEN